jgi:hypothetical protein
MAAATSLSRNSFRGFVRVELVCAQQIAAAKNAQSSVDENLIGSGFLTFLFYQQFLLRLRMSRRLCDFQQS